MSVKKIEKSIKQVIEQSFSKVLQESKYGGTLYRFEDEDHFCGVFCYKSHVNVEFPHGYKMVDPDGVLKGSGKYRRHLQFSEIDTLSSSVLKKYLAASRKLAKEAGNKN